MKSVCYYTMGHPLISRRVGGAEIQLYLIGKELQKTGWTTHYLVDDEGQPDRLVREGQVLHKVRTFKRSTEELLAAAPAFAANALLTYDHPFFSSVLDRFTTDIYHQRGSNIATGYFAHHANKVGRPFVFTIASSEDCSLTGNVWRGLFRSTVKKRLYLYGIRNARVIIATANYLARSMAKLLPDADIRLIPSGHPVPERLPAKADPPFAIWVGRTADYKFPTVFVQLAKALPEHKFVLVGAMSEGDLIGRTYDAYAATMAEAAKVPNLRILPFQPLDKVNEMIARAAVLVDTSDVAGFPNTFIQAWLRRTPVASLSIDPDDVMKRRDIGINAGGSFDKLVESVRILLEDRRENGKIGARALAYAKANHDIRVTGKRHDALYRELME